MALDWDRRQLCPDGACVGVIGSGGTCSVCGRVAPNWGEERKRGLAEPPDEPEENDDEDEDDDSADPIAPSAPAAIGKSAWSARQLCPDGGCIGVIGDDGTCKVCGKRAGDPVNVEEEEDAEADELATHGGEDDEAYEDEDEDEEDADEDEEEDEDEDEGDEELAAAADQLAGVATSKELAGADQLATAGTVEDDERKLCPDGACVGLIGDDGRCKICGKAAA